MTRLYAWFVQTHVSRRFLPAFFFLMGLFFSGPLLAEAAPTWPYANETHEQRDTRMQWWRQARFGMFIHWGVYSVPAGTYNDKKIGGIGEWIMFQGEIPVKDYKAYAKQFNPVKYDPDAWVQLAKEAGMKYIVITSKHHDGFALFDSKVTDWDVVDATPYGKDLLKPLAEACRKHGLKLGFYYSQAQDWCHPGGAKAGGKQWDTEQAGDMDQYLREIAVPQVKEILSNYGDIAVLWWDTPSNMNTERAAMFEPVVSEFPGIITNNRLGGGYRGDSETPEQHIPATGYKDRDWETCMTLNDTWGFKSYDHNWKSTETVIRNLVDITSKGGNYLLNVGPTAEGEIPQPSIERLKEVGQWMRVNGDAIYGTSASPFTKLDWGRCTKKVYDSGATLYLHVFNWPKDGKLLVPGLKNKIKSARLMASEQAIKAESVSDGLMLSLPAACPDPIATVITVEIEGAPTIEKVLPKQSADGTVLLSAAIADIHNGTGSDAQVETKDNLPNIGYWTDAQSWVEWQFKVERPGVFTVTAQIAGPAQGSRADIKVGDAVLPVTFPATGSYDTFQTHQFGTVTIEKAGNYALQIRPVSDAWKPINLRFVMLSPIPPVVTETSAQRDARMQWWRQARFGMFVHWGLYSGLAGTWEGKPVGTRGGMEWIQNRVGADTATYAQRAIPLFKPSPTFAAEWAALAKAAGCRYLVFTTKHHDGFALHDSQVSDYDAGSVLKRDLVREIVDAARAAGLRVGFYHSVIDWHHDQYDYSLSKQLPHPLKGKGDPVPPRDHANYLEYLHAQVNELISNYGPVDVMWWDYSAQDFQGQAAWRAFDLMNAVRAKQPAIIMNNRLFRTPEAGWASMGTDGYTMKLDSRYGDFITPEQHIPDTGTPGMDWETCMTMNTTWGYSEHDNAWKSSETLIRNLADIVSKGGNYLLNIGPKADGSVPQESIVAMQAIGRWMEANGEAIYDTTASPFEKLDWGRCTKKVSDGGTTLYLHVFEWPKDGKLLVPGLKNTIQKASLLATGAVLTAEASPAGAWIHLPAAAPDTAVSVIRLQTVGVLEIDKTPPAPAQEQAALPQIETPAQRDARMQWWRDARFGMFIHWGVYAVPAGTHNGKQIPDIGEWIMTHGKIPVKDYKAYAKQFNPVKYDPDAWVQLAKEAGMKYIVITSKHHDGFALFDSKVTDWDVVDATPYGKDLLKPLAEACRKHGLKLGFYYSQAQDWCHPGGATADWAGGRWDPAQAGDMDQYLRSIAVPQVKEILSNYGDIAVLWWDTPFDMTKERADTLLPLLSLQPGIITNNRLGHYPGDTETPEQHIPATGFGDRDWETCMTMNDTWGFKSYDNNWKSAKMLLRNLIDIASKGGNYLLNVGPTAEGEIPAASVERLKQIGKWMQVNGEAIYGTSASPFARLEWGRCTKKVSDGGATLYLHIFDWPKDGILRVPGLKNKVTSARLLTTGQTLRVETGDDGVALTVPAASPDPVAAVVEVRVEGPLMIEKIWPKQAGDGTVTLPALLADIYNVQGTNTQVELKQDIYNIGHWTGSQCRVQWQFRIDRPGIFEVAGQIAIQGESRAELKIGDKTLTAVFAATGSYDIFQTQRLGTIAIEKPGLYTFEIRPDKDAWNPINVRLLTLTPLVGPRAETKAQFDARMQWWRDARFGMFIHWGVYSVPAGEWNGKTNYAEWIREQAQIPLEQYEPLCEQFNPMQFDADAWVRMARDAGMKYLVITSKHHDGFCLWDSAAGDYTMVKRTPFKRDILGELAKACKTYNVRLCFYHSIMDWHHPDYLPRRSWEKRSAEGADYSRYIAYMKAQLKELIIRYDPGVLWFDGEWESTWTHEMGLDLYDYVRSLKPDIIINNRVDKGRRGMQGTYETSQFAGDFGTPEQEIPATGLDYDWESCITMNGHWGWNKNDKAFKSAEDMIRSLVDIASKGGNYLLNIGPKPDGTFPQESIERLAQMGQWMKVNGESIYGTSAGPFAKLDWGRCTQKQDGGDTLLYLHVFSAPADGTLVVDGLENEILQATLLATQQSLTTARSDNRVIVQLPADLPDAVDTVIVLKIKGRPRVEAAAGAL